MVTFLVLLHIAIFKFFPEGMMIWLVVSNMNFIFHHIWDNPSPWLSYFSEGVAQPPTSDDVFGTEKIWIYKLWEAAWHCGNLWLRPGWFLVETLEIQSTPGCWSTSGQHFSGFSSHFRYLPFWMVKRMFFLSKTCLHIYYKPSRGCFSTFFRKPLRVCNLGTKAHKKVMVKVRSTKSMAQVSNRIRNLNPKLWSVTWPCRKVCWDDPNCQPVMVSGKTMTAVFGSFGDILAIGL